MESDGNTNIYNMNGGQGIVVACFKILSGYSVRVTEESKEKAQ
jgi:hypothetical protein